MTKARYNLEHSIKLYKQKAEFGDSEAQYALALAYYDNQSAIFALESALKYFTDAAKLGHPAASYDLAYIYLKGEYVERNIEESQKLFKISLDKEYGPAQYRQALLNENGENANENRKETINLFKQAAHKNIAGAQFSLAVLYQEGLGFEEGFDPKATDQIVVDLCKQAASSGLPPAMLTLAHFYLEDLTLQCNYQEVLRLVKSVMKQGNNTPKQQEECENILLDLRKAIIDDIDQAFSLKVSEDILGKIKDLIDVSKCPLNEDLDSDGNTILHFIYANEDFKIQEHQEIIDFLHSKGALMNQNKQGKAPEQMRNN